MEKSITELFEFNENLARRICKNVVFFGRNSMLSGLMKRIKKEMNDLCGDKYSVKVNPDNEIDARDSLR